MHGLWDSPRIFKKLISQLEDDEIPIYTPFLPHDFGRTSIRRLAEDLNEYVLNEIGSHQTIDLLGFSMGGIISRLWLQEWNGFSRTNHFISIGSPHNGTLTAQLVPSFLFPGVSEMKKGSQLLFELNKGTSKLKKVKCTSFFCFWDLMSFPGWQSVLPIGDYFRIPVLTHKDLISHPIALDMLGNKILNGAI